MPDTINDDDRISGPSGPEEEVRTRDGEDKSKAPTYKTFQFPSHKSHMLSIAQLCKSNSEYSDCLIMCDNGAKLKAHRLVLGAASGFLREVFDSVPRSLIEATVMVPDVKEEVVSALIDFLYTGEMKINRQDTAELQLLVQILQIDPELISVEEHVAEKDSSENGGKGQADGRSQHQLRPVDEPDGDSKDKDSASSEQNPSIGSEESLSKSSTKRKLESSDDVTVKKLKEPDS